MREHTVIFITFSQRAKALFHQSSILQFFVSATNVKQSITAKGGRGERQVLRKLEQQARDYFVTLYR